MTTKENPTFIKSCPKEPELSLVSFAADDKFCWHCGTALVTVMQPACACGHPVMRSENFCPKCGAKKPEPMPAADVTSKAPEPASVPIPLVDECPF